MITVLSAVFVWKKGQQGANSLADTNCHILKVQVPPGLALPAGILPASAQMPFLLGVGSSACATGR